MHQPGVEVRPLREMTGHAMFNEVFLTDARVADDAMIGGRNNGWAVANTTLMYERAGLGAGGGSARRRARRRRARSPATSTSGPATSSAAPTARGAGRRRSAAHRRRGKMLIELAKGNGTIKDPTIRQDLMRLHTLGEIGRYNNLRLKAAEGAGQGHPRHGQHRPSSR